MLSLNSGELLNREKSFFSYPFDHNNFALSISIKNKLLVNYSGKTSAFVWKSDSATYIELAVNDRLLANRIVTKSFNVL